MPALMDIPELMEYTETHDFTIETREQPRPRSARPGFWRTLAQKIGTYVTFKPRAQHIPACHAHRRFEAPMDQFAREYPWVSVYALAVI